MACESPTLRRAITPTANSKWRCPSTDQQRDSELEFQLEVSYEEEPDKSVTFISDVVREMEEITRDDVRLLLEYFAKTPYRCKGDDPKADEFSQTCLKLFSRDYHYFEIDNLGGELSTHYPSRLVILEYERSPNAPIRRENEGDSLYQSLYDVSKLKDLCLRARLARCRARFPIPVILLDGKHICRSATLSGGPEIYGRSSYDFFFAGKTGTTYREEEGEDDEESEIPVPQTSSDWQLFDRVRSQDIRLLRLLSVSHICDLMVEKKKVKFGMKITSSEKVDKENRYSEFTILSLPYPGCEFFREYSANGYNASGLVFTWNQPYVDARLVIPNDNVAGKLDVDWKSYKSWDIVRLTQNYLKLLLKYVSHGTGGLLIHCISGWDRTPLFVSLLRLSLWADGKIHQSLKPLEILYLTLAYDWFLFGHNLPDRLGKGEEILFFCFDFLKNITSEEFSLRGRRSLTRCSETDCDDLLDAVNVRGSNTSLNSSCSSVSTRSQDCPLFFTTGSYESSDETANSTPVISSDGNHRIPVSNPSVSEMTGGSPLIISRSSTTPVAVPSNIGRCAESGSAFSCGSWQIISGTGSLRGSTSQTPSSDVSANSRPSRSSLTWSDTGDAECVSVFQQRSQRLHAVRNAFHNLYVSAVGFRFRNGPDVSGGGLSGFLDHFAEKVGIRTGRVSQ